MLNFAPTADSKGMIVRGRYGGIPYTGNWRGSGVVANCGMARGPNGNPSWAEACGKQEAAQKKKAAEMQAIYCKAGGVHGCS
jgi:hypothetical protein